MITRPTAFILLTFSTALLRADCLVSPPEIPRLVEQRRWEQAAECIEAIPGRSADEQYRYGRALAALGRRADAKAAFEAGRRLAPRDPRFPAELAGLAFLDERYSDAKGYLKQGLRLAPHDRYLIDFLGTVYLLEENLDAALLYWNRIDKPRVEGVDLDVSPHTDRVLLDRAFAIAPASTLRLRELELTRARLKQLDLYSQQRFDLLAREGQGYDLRFQALEHPRWGDSKFGAAVSLLSGVPYQTVHPEFRNVDGGGLHVRSLARWDPRMRRLHVSISKPVGRDPSRRLSLFVDGRDEEWRLATERGAGEGFELRKAEAGLEYSVVSTSRFAWRTGVSIATRQFREAASPLSAPDASVGLAYEGPSASALFGVEAAVLRLPEQRFTLDAEADWRVGRVLRDSPAPYSRWTQTLRMRWFPQARGEDYALLARWSSGQTFGRTPFDELYALGMERDNHLWLRGHAGTADGYKGAALLGDRYQLVNLELDKIVYRHPLLKLTMGPFLDAGSIRDSRGMLGSSGWQFDAGLQGKARLAGGLQFVVSYGRNVQSGGDALFWRIVR